MFRILNGLTGFFRALGLFASFIRPNMNSESVSKEKELLTAAPFCRVAIIKLVL